MIRAIYQQGSIQMLDAVPPDWRDGQELLVQEAAAVPSPAELDAWATDVEAAAAKVAAEDHGRFMAILAEVEAESKELGRQELERTP